MELYRPPSVTPGRYAFASRVCGGLLALVTQLLVCVTLVSAVAQGGAGRVFADRGGCAVSARPSRGAAELSSAQAIFAFSEQDDEGDDEGDDDTGDVATRGQGRDRLHLVVECEPVHGRIWRLRYRHSPKPPPSNGLRAWFLGASDFAACAKHKAA